MGDTACIIVAAGASSRMGQGIDKMRLCLAGRPLLAYAISAFEDSPDVDEIILVVREDSREWVSLDLLPQIPHDKVSSIVSGGSTRQKSVFNGLLCLRDETEIVVVHDGARPLVRGETIHEVVGCAREFGAAVCGVRVKDTIKEVGADGLVSRTLERDLLWSVQTPQAFDKSILITSHKLAEEEGFLGTDDASLVERYGFKVKMVPGSYDNIKITTSSDVMLFEAFWRERN
ncbi:MAG: 2-C-methyl-D-erythritol 4-phosphate cytidylyltransferase [Firmicutes bacterium]|nr:2-C-methyl-D-erythritol 4-phosphate cytidylyltransferase [Bacillota bacterium]